MNSITINGTTITSGGSITVSNGRIVVNGRDVTPDAKTINIVITGNVEYLNADAVNVLEIKGSVTGNVATASGNVKCGDVHGSVSSMSGNVRCGSIGGNAKTMSGDITHN